MTKLKLSFTSVAVALPLAMCGCGHKQPQTDNMTSNSMTTNAMDNMTPSKMGHMESNSMHMGGSSMNNVTNSPPAGNDVGFHEGYQSIQMNDMTSNVN